MEVNQGIFGCQNCKHREKNINYGLICQHKASMEGIEVEKEFYKVSEVKECNFYMYDDWSIIDR